MQGDIFDLASTFLSRYLPQGRSTPIQGQTPVPRPRGPSVVPREGPGTAMMVTPAQSAVPGASGVQGPPAGNAPVPTPSGFIAQQDQPMPAVPLTEPKPGSFIGQDDGKAIKQRLARQASEQGPVGKMLGLPEGLSDGIGAAAYGVARTDPTLSPFQAAASGYFNASEMKTAQQERKDLIHERAEEKERVGLSREAQKTALMRRGFANSEDEALALIDMGVAPELIVGSISPEKKTAAMQNYELAQSQGYEGSFMDFETDMKKAGATTIDLGEDAYAKEQAKLAAQDYQDLQMAGRTASTQLGKYDRMEALMSNPDLYTGTGGQLAAQAKRAAQAFGLDVEGLSETEAFTALSNELALQMRNPAGGAGMPGSMSDSDRTFLVSTVPNLGNSREGNLLLIESMRRIQQRNVDVARLANDYVRTTGRLDAGFYDELAGWSEANPLFADLAPPEQATSETMPVQTQSTSGGINWSIR